MSEESTNVNKLFFKAIDTGSIKDAFNLLNSGKFDVNATNELGNTALHIVHNLEMLQQLIKAGALLDIQNCKGETPLHFASKKWSTEKMKILLDSGAKVNVQNNAGDTPLHLSYNWPSSDLSGMLIKRGALVNLKNKKEETPLHLACQYDNCTLMNFLIDGGASLNAINFNNNTPLHYAAHNGNFLAVNTLVKKKALTDVQNCRGDTPLHIVARGNRRFCDTPIAVNLINAGARVDIRNNDGQTPYDIVPYPTIIKNLIKVQVIKLYMLDIPVDVNCCSLDDFKESDLAKNCVKELEIIENTKFDENTKFEWDNSLKIIFSMKDKPFYLRHKERVESLESVLYSKFLEDQFPLYTYIIRHTYERSKQRFNLLLRASNSFSHPCRQISFQLIPDLIREKIVIQLSDEELENFLRSEIN